MARADHLLSQKNIPELRAQLHDKAAEKGSVLWQGKRGLCISLENSVAADDRINVLCLQDPEGVATFKKGFIFPIEKIIYAGLIPETDDFGNDQQNKLLKVLDQLKTIQI